MNKRRVAKVALFLIAIAVFNVLYFNVIEIHTPARWVSYAGIHMAYLLLCVSSFSTGPGESGSVVHAYPKMMVAYGYFIASLVCGLVLILINNSTITFPLVVHATIVGFYIFHYLLLMNAEEHTAGLENSRTADARFLDEGKRRLKFAMDSAPSREAWREISRLNDALTGATSARVATARDVEEHLADLIRQIADTAGTAPDGLHALVDEAVGLVRERELKISLEHKNYCSGN